MSKIISDSEIPLNFFNFFKGLYYRNKAVLVVSVAIFFSFLFIGLLIGYISSDFIGNLLKTYVNLLQGAKIEITTLSIFMHNLQAALIAYFGGIIGIIPFGVLSFNGFFYGAFLGYLMHGSIVTSSGVLTTESFIIYTMPHGIFEFTGFVIAGAAGFRITTLVIGVIKSKIEGKPIGEHYWKLKDSLALLAIAIVLIFIAAIIEANITLSLGNYITNLNLTNPNR